MDSNKKRPRRQRKGDRLLAPGATKNQIMVDHAVAPFDRAATECERKWGYDRLPELVSPATAARFGAAIAFLNDAINKSDPQQAATAAQNCIKGLGALEAEAVAAGHIKPQAITHGDVDGWAFRIVADAGDPAPKDGIPTFTLREVGLALKAQLSAPIIEEVKKHFPRAEVTKTKPAVNWKDGGDQIPF